MAQPAPVLLLNGSVHACNKRHVEAVEARPAQYDEDGRFMRPAIDARDGYDTYDVLVLTEGGGFLTLVFSLDAVKAAEGHIPSHGDTLSGLPVRTFRTWAGAPGRRYATTGYSAAAELVKPEHVKAPSSGSRSLSAAG